MSASPKAATASDLDAVTDTISAAFEHDPLWSWALPDLHGREQVWRLFIGSALRFPWVWFTPGYAAASVWIPPGESELGAEEERLFDPLIRRLAGPRADDVFELFGRFDASHPRDRPHYYLSLLGTHPDHRGSGIGMGLLADNLARIDEERMPAYLESSNPVNIGRYEGVGFVPVGRFETPDGSRTVTTMWRDPRSPGR